MLPTIPHYDKKSPALQSRFVLCFQPGPAGAFAQEVTVLPLNVSTSEDEIRHGMIIGIRLFNENTNI